MESHYCRSSTSKLYLEPRWQSILSLYKEYEKYCKHKDLVFCSIKLYRDQFHELNVCLFTPKKDQCYICCGYKTGNVNNIIYALHIDNKNLARSEKGNDTATN